MCGNVAKMVKIMNFLYSLTGLFFTWLFCIRDAMPQLKKVDVVLGLYQYKDMAFQQTELPGL